MEKSCRIKYEQITKTLIGRQLTVSVMESCTGGLVSSLITDTEGSSAVTKGGFVTYSNEAKIAAGVPKEVIDSFGVYSKETARAMAEAARAAFDADFGLGITGSMANADPANPDSVPGKVFFCISQKNGDAVQVTLNGINAAARYEGKLMAAERIADEFMKLLDQ